MRDELERFIARNREAFDNKTPPSAVWENIESKLENKEAKRVFLRHPLSIAASVLILLAAGMAIGWSLFPVLQSGSSDPLAVDMQEAEAYYQDEVDERLTRLASYEEDPGVKQDMEQLDSMILELKMELANIPRGNEEETINAIIQNYQMKIEILERVLSNYQQNEAIYQQNKQDE